MFIKYECAGCKTQVRDLLRKRLDWKEKIRYHERKIEEIKNVKIPEVETKLNMYLNKAKL